MSNGLMTWNADSTVQMTTDDFTYYELYNAIHNLATEVEVHVTLPDFNPSTCTAVILPVDPVSYTELGMSYNGMPYMSLSLGRIDVYRRNPSYTQRPQSTIRFRLLVMRYQ